MALRRTTLRALLALAVLAVASLPAGAQVSCAQQPVNVAFYASNVEPYTGESVTFTDDTTTTSGNQVVSWSWDFGDAYTSTFQSPIHAYQQPGQYQVYLRATDNRSPACSATNTQAKIITVRVPPGTPADPGTPELVADAGADQEVQGGDNVTLTGRAYGATTTLVSYEWRQTGGPQVNLVNLTSSTMHFTSPNPTEDIRISVALRVFEGNRQSREDEVNITVRPHAVTIRVDAGGDRTAARGESVTLDGSGTSAPGGVTLTYKWRQLAGAPVILSGSTTARATFTVPAQADAPLEFVLEVTGGTTTLSDSVRVFVTAPRSGSTSGIQASVRDRTVTVSALVAGSNITWDWGDGRSQGKGATTGHLYQRDGNFTITMSLTTPTGVVQVYTQNVTVANPVLTTTKAAPQPGIAAGAALLALASACRRRAARSP